MNKKSGGLQIEARICEDVAHVLARLREATRVVEGRPAKFLVVDNKTRCDDESDIRFFLKKDDAETYSSENGHLPMFSIDKYSGKTGSAGKYFAVCSYEKLWKVYEKFARPAYGSPLFAPDVAWRKYGELCDTMREKTNLLGKEDLEHIRYQKQQCLDQALVVLPFMYEVVKFDVPCNLYLDLEGCRVTNPSIDFETLTERLLLELRAFMCNMGLAPKALMLNPRLVTLDSSTTVKFSRHVIYKLPQCMFKNNYICGALMRNFHLHLIQRFGPEESNPFYIHPFADAKSETKLCFLDFAVYTTNRDFRLLGSCKRKGCSSETTQLRWLWMQGRPDELTKELFMDCLIQRVEQNPKYLICRVVDTINNGVPCSSSLRTPQPAAIAAGTFCGVIGAIGPLPFGVCASNSNSQATTLMLPATLRQRLERFGIRVAQFLCRTPDEPFRSYFRDGKSGCKKISLRILRDGNYAWSVETTCRHCIIRKQKCGSAEHKDGGRKATFVVWATGLTKHGTYDETKVGSIKQMCIANSCTGGAGAASPSWSGWLGTGLPADLRGNVNAELRPWVMASLPPLGIYVHCGGHAVQVASPLFDYDPEYDHDLIQAADQAVNQHKREREEREEREQIAALDRVTEQYQKKQKKK